MTRSPLIADCGDAGTNDYVSLIILYHTFQKKVKAFLPFSLKFFVNNLLNIVQKKKLKLGRRIYLGYSECSS